MVEKEDFGSLETEVKRTYLIVSLAMQLNCVDSMVILSHVKYVKIS